MTMFRFFIILILSGIFTFISASKPSGFYFQEKFYEFGAFLDLPSSNSVFTALLNKNSFYFPEEYREIRSAFAPLPAEMSKPGFFIYSVSDNNIKRALFILNNAPVNENRLMVRISNLIILSNIRQGSFPVYLVSADIKPTDDNSIQLYEENLNKDLEISSGLIIKKIPPVKKDRNSYIEPLNINVPGFKSMLKGRYGKGVQVLGMYGEQLVFRVFLQNADTEKAKKEWSTASGWYLYGVYDPYNREMVTGLSRVSYSIYTK